MSTFPFGLLPTEVQFLTLDLYMALGRDDFKSCWNDNKKVPTYTPKWLLEIACVNRNFYKYFMSDKLWAPFDVYNVHNQISRHYLEMAFMMKPRERRELVCSAPMGNPDWSDSLYTQLNVLQNNFFRWEDGPQILNKQLFSCLIYNNPPQRLDRLPPKDTLLRIMCRNPWIFASCYDQKLENGFVRDDFDLVYAAVSVCGGLLQYASSTLRRDRRVVEAAVASCGMALQMSLGFKHDRQLAITAVTHPHQCCELDTLSSEFCDDKEVVLKAVEHGGFELKHASERLRADGEVVLRAILDEPEAFQFASEDLKNNAELSMIAINEDWSSVRYCGNELRADPIFVGRAIAINDACAIYCMPEYALATEPDLILLRLEHNLEGTVLPLELSTSKEFMMRAIAVCPGAIALTPHLNNDRDIVEAATLCNNHAFVNLEFVSFELRGDKEFMTKAVTINGRALQYASPELLVDVDLIFIAAASDINVLPPASRRLLSDRSFILQVAKVICNYDDFFWRNYMQRWCNDKEVVWSLVRRWPEAFMFAGPYLCDSEALLLTAFAGEWSNKFLQIWRHASQRLRQDKQVQLAAFALKGRRFVLDMEFLADKQMMGYLDALEEHELGSGALDLWRWRVGEVSIGRTVI